MFSGHDTAPALMTPMQLRSPAQEQAYNISQHPQKQHCLNSGDMSWVLEGAEGVGLGILKSRNSSIVCYLQT